MGSRAMSMKTGCKQTILINDALSDPPSGLVWTEGLPTENHLFFFQTSGERRVVLVIMASLDPATGKNTSLSQTEVRSVSDTENTN